MEINDVGEKIKETLKNNYKLIIFVICILGFLIIAHNIFEKEIMQIDTNVYNFISEYFISDYFTPVVKFITNFGGAIFLISLVIAVFILVKNKKIGLYIFINLCCATILNILLKNILQRPRPTGFRLIDETGYSFPSGHSMISMAFYGYLIYLIYKKVKNKYLKWTGIIGLSILIFCIGISRIYLGVHYATDVAAGFLVAIAYLLVYIKVTKKMIES